MSFKTATIEAIQKLIADGSDEIIEKILRSFLGGFERQNGDVIELYLDEEFIEFCNNEFGLELHSTIEKIMKN